MPYSALTMASRSIRWNPEKDVIVRATEGRRGIGLADCAAAIENNDVLDDATNSSRPHQRIFVVEIDGYAYCVPYVIEQDGGLFLKTVYPSRKATRKYLGY